MRQASCINCIFFLNETGRVGLDAGKCQRYPPVLCLRGTTPDHPSWVQPVVGEFDYCGEHKPIG
jgi:hypothetical protein